MAGGREGGHHGGIGHLRAGGRAGPGRQHQLHSGPRIPAGGAGGPRGRVSLPGGTGRRPGLPVLLHRRHQQDQGQHRRLHHAPHSVAIKIIHQGDPRRTKKNNPRRATKNDEGPLRRWRGIERGLARIGKGGADRREKELSGGDRPREKCPPGARASRPHPYSCKQPPIQGHSPARRTKPAFTGFSSM